MRIGILALQGDFSAHARMLERLGLRLDPRAGQAPSPGDYYVWVRQGEDLQGLDGLILPGGESTTQLHLLRRQNMTDQLREYAASHCVFGTCAGAILQAMRVIHPRQESLGTLDIEIERNAYGRQIDSFAASGHWREKLLPPSAAPVPEMIFIRAPRILTCGPEVEVLARLDQEPVLVRQGRQLAATFHPELTTNPRLHQLFLNMVHDSSNPGRREAGLLA